MAINSYKQDENINDVGKLKTLGRLFSYLLAHKASIVVVLLIMAYCVCVSLVNPLIIEAAIDNHISTGDYAGLYRLAHRTRIECDSHSISQSPHVYHGESVQ